MMELRRSVKVDQTQESDPMEILKKNKGRCHILKLMLCLDILGKLSDSSGSFDGLDSKNIDDRESLKINDLKIQIENKMISE